MPPFDYANFIISYPQFSNLTQTECTDAYLYNAKIFYNFVFDYFTDANQQYYWSTVVLAHILTLVNSTNSGLSATVGRVISTDTGDIKVKLDAMVNSQDSKWWQQTRYGSMVYAVMQQNGIVQVVAL